MAGMQSAFAPPGSKSMVAPSGGVSSMFLLSEFDTTYNI